MCGKYARQQEFFLSNLSRHYRDETYDLFSPDRSGILAVPIPKLRDGTGRYSQEQEGSGYENEGFLLLKNK
jgi:hypothetical protein